MQLKVTWLTALFFLVGLVILIEQTINYGIFFDLNDIHHETFALSSFMLAIGLLMGSKLSRK